MANKLTNRKALAIACDVMNTLQAGNDEAVTVELDDQQYLVDEVIEKLTAMMVALDNKTASTTRRPTKVQIENEKLRAAILAFLNTEPNLIVTCTDLSVKVPELAGFQNQKISSLMRQLVDYGYVNKTIVKNKSYFQLTEKEARESD